MIYVFVVDTSASMNQVFSHGLSYLDVTKSGIEHFFKWEQWRSDRKQNKYVLIDYSDPPFCLKAGINDTIPSLLNELKSLSATDMSNPGQAFHAAFEYINAYRFQAGLETLGKGRYLNNIEPTLFLWFTDGGNFSVVDRGGSGRCFVNNKLQIPGLKTPGAFAYFEPFRWDQRMHTFLLHPEGKAVHPEVAAMSNASNGDVYAIWSKDHMKRCIENAMGTQKPPHPDVFPQSATATFSSITLQMEELSETSVEPRRVFRLNVFPQADQNTFPLPEQYWVSRELNSPPTKNAVPILSYLATNLSHSIPINFPYDRFSIDQQHWGELLRLAAEKARHTTAGLCWTIYAKNSGRTPGLGEPIGFFKITTNVAKGNVVMMYLLPYNFPRLFRIIDRLNKNPEMKQSLPSTIINEFRAYLAECPPYYHAKLRLVLGRLGLERLMPDSLAQDMSAWPISSFLATTCDQAKVEFGKFNSAVSDKNRIKSEEQRRLAITTAQVVTPEILVENAFDVSRARILSELKQLQSQFNLVGLTDGVDKTAKKTIQKLVRNQDLEDALHSVPISEMTNHNAKPFVAPLRSPFESDDELVEMAKRDPFGNPWAVHKTMRAAGSYAGSDGSSGGDEVANEASLLQAGDKAVDDAKREADLVNASLHARRPRKLGGKVFMDGASARGSSLAGDSEMTRVTVGTVTSRATSIFDRMPSIVAGFPVLVVPPSAVSFGDIVTGRVDLSEWTEKARKEAQDNQEAADKAEAVILDQEKALLSAAAVRNWNLPPPSNPLTSPVTSIIPVPNTPDLVTSSRNQASSLDKSRTAHMPLLAQFLAKGQMATHEPTSTHHQDANEVLPPSSNSQALSSKIALQDPTPLDNDFDMLIDKHLNGASTPVGKIQQANSLKRSASLDSRTYDPKNGPEIQRTHSRSSSGHAVPTSLDPHLKRAKTIVDSAAGSLFTLNGRQSQILGGGLPNSFGLIQNLPQSGERVRPHHNLSGSSNSFLLATQNQMLHQTNQAASSSMQHQDVTSIPTIATMRGQSHTNGSTSMSHLFLSQTHVPQPPAGAGSSSHIFPFRPHIPQLSESADLSKLQGEWYPAVMPIVTLPKGRKFRVCYHYNVAKQEPAGCKFPHLCCVCACLGRQEAHRAVDMHPEYTSRRRGRESS